MIEGEAGIGKTTLWREGLRLAKDKSLILTSRASQAETRLSFTVLGDLLEPTLDSVLPGLPPGQRGALEAALLLQSPTRSRPDSRAVSLAVYGALRSAASAGPLTIAIDDVQWTDPPSANALAFAVRRLVDVPVFVVATKRLAPGLSDPIDLGAVSGGVERLVLGPMEPASLGRVLRQSLGRQFARPLVQRIHAASGGNPFFAIEIGRALDSGFSDQVPGEPLPIPPDLQELLRDRLLTISTSARRMLVIAAASPDPSMRLLEAAGGDAARMDEAEEAGILRLKGSSIAFTHPLLASAVYGEASSRVRRDVHAQLAAVATDPEERARHLALSVRGPDDGVAVALDAAALHAEARGAPVAAAELYLLASKATPKDHLEELRLRRQGALGDLYAAGDFAGARSLNEQLIADLEPGPGRAYALYTLAVMSWHDLPRVKDLCTRALNEAGDDLQTRSWVLAELAWATLWGCDPAAAIPLAEKALAISRPEDVGQLRSALPVRALAGFMLGQDMSAHLERGMSLDDALGYGDLSTPGICLGRQQLWIGDIDTARQSLQDEFDRYVDQGHEALSWQVRTDLAEVEYRAGRWSLANRLVQEASDIVADVGWPNVLGYILPVKSAIESACGEVELARADGVEALTLSERLGDRWDEIRARAALGFLELSLGDHAACHAWLDPLVELTEGMGLRESGVFPFVPDEVEALVALGSLDTATRVTDRLEEQARDLDRPLALATATRCRGLIAAGNGDLGQAERDLSLAVRMHARVAQPFERGRTLLVAGVVHRRNKKKKSARDLLEDATAIFEEIGAPLWVAKARAELGRVGGRLSTRGGLTSTERRVAELAATGLMNKEIADKLFISVKTVEANLSRAYHKLGIRSRRELRASIENLDSTDG